MTAMHCYRLNVTKGSGMTMEDGQIEHAPNRTREIDRPKLIRGGRNAVGAFEAVRRMAFNNYLHYQRNFFSKPLNKKMDNNKVRQLFVKIQNKRKGSFVLLNYICSVYTMEIKS